MDKILFKVVCTKLSSAYSCDTIDIQVGKVYDVSIFDNSTDEVFYMLEDDSGGTLWYVADSFERLDDIRDRKIDEVLNG